MIDQYAAPERPVRIPRSQLIQSCPFYFEYKLPSAPKGVTYDDAILDTKVYKPLSCYFRETYDDIK